MPLIRHEDAVDPASIPQHVVDAAWKVRADSASMRHQIAAALDALMDDEPIRVKRDAYGTGMVRPSDVLAAVLARATPEPMPDNEEPA